MPATAPAPLAKPLHDRPADQDAFRLLVVWPGTDGPLPLSTLPSRLFTAREVSETCASARYSGEDPFADGDGRARLYAVLPQIGCLPVRLQAHYVGTDDSDWMTYVMRVIATDGDGGPDFARDLIQFGMRIDGRA